jgi:diacylglycerol kinase (ATP)
MFTRRFSRGLRLIVAGGDGTVGSVIAMLQDLEKAGELATWPAIAVLPLGTGNDLARVLGWGGGWAGEPLSKVLAAAETASETLVDLWRARISPLQSAGHHQAQQDDEGGDSPSSKGSSLAFTNYLGVGIDARIAARFDQMRRCFPRLFRNRTLNKVHYFWVGAIEFFASLGNSCAQIGKEVILRCDGKEFRLGGHVRGIIFSNINSYGGGSKLTAQCSHQDGKLDVVLISGPFGGVPHLALVKLGLARGLTLCQASSVELTTRTQLPVQADGEPWEQPPSRFEVEPCGTQASMLQREGTEQEGCEVVLHH